MINVLQVARLPNIRVSFVFTVFHFMLYVLMVFEHFRLLPFCSVVHFSMTSFGCSCHH